MNKQEFLTNDDFKRMNDNSAILEKITEGTQALTFINEINSGTFPGIGDQGYNLKHAGKKVSQYIQDLAGLLVGVRDELKQMDEDVEENTKATKEFTPDGKYIGKNTKASKKAGK